MAVKYANAYTEVYKILECLEEEEYEKIPDEFLQVIEENRNLDYEYEVNEEQDSNWEETDKKHQLIEVEKEKAKLEIFAEMVANKVLEKMNGTREEETTPELVEEEKGQERASIDYSEFEERIANLSRA